MSDFFLHIYRFFRKKKLVFYAILMLASALIFLAAVSIRFEEDISGTVQGSDPKDKAAGILRDLNLTDRLVIDISLGDTAAPANPDSLESFAEELADSLSSVFDSSLVSKIIFRAPDSVMNMLMNLVADHLPVFLDERDYAAIDRMLQPAAIEKALDRDFRILVSPAGIVLRNRLMSDPLGIMNPALEKLKSLREGGQFDVHNGCVVTSDRRHLLIFIQPANPASETGMNSALIRGLDRIIASLESKHRVVKARYFGGVAVAVANAEQLKTDIALTLSIAILLILLLTGWYFRSARIPLLGLLPALFGAGVALALLYLMKGRISAISLGIGSVILGLIVDYSLYLVTNYRKNGDIERTLKEMSQTIVLCALTSAGAFLCLTFLRSSVLRDLGWFAAFSVSGAALFALTVLPQFLTPQMLRIPTEDRINLVNRLASAAWERKTWLAIAIIVLCFAACFFAGRTGFEKNMSSLSYMTPQLAKAEADLDRISSYKLKKVYMVATGRTTEEALRNLESRSDCISTLAGKGVIQGISGAGPLLTSDSLQRERIARWNMFWTSEKRVQVIENITRIAKQKGFRPEAFDRFFKLIEGPFSTMTLREIRNTGMGLTDDRLIEKPGKTLVTLTLHVAEKDLPQVYRGFPTDSRVVAFDRQSLTSSFVEGVRKDFELLVNLSMIFVTLLLIISFGRIELGLMTAIPMFMSWLMTLGLMGLTGIRFNIFNIIISSFIFGLGVDYSILMMKGLQHSLQTGQTDLRTYRVSVLLSSITTLIGVGVLFFARHPALQSIALISVAGVTAVVVISFVIPPMIFNFFILERQKQGKYPVTLRIMLKTLVTWGDIVLIAVILMILGFLIKTLLPISRKKKEILFHHLFHRLTDFYIRFTFAFDMKVINTSGEHFDKPAIIISNHQSLIETPAFLRLHPRILIMTAPWVYRSPVFGPIARLANFFNIDKGIDSILEPLKKKMKEGYSILIFPEAHRSAEQKIQRFHRGAFYLAEKLQADILPVLVFGTGDFLGKGVFFGRPNGFRMKIMPRVTCSDTSLGKDYQERARKFRRYYIAEYAKLREEEGTARYYRRHVALNFIFRGPILEWYMKVKMKLENNWDLYARFMPRQGEILDLGCGYGFISYMLMFTGEGRRITGVDHDAEKISIASGGFSKNERLDFVCADITEFEITRKAGFILGDVLHYLTPGQQQGLLRRCFECLEPGGVIMIREADAGLEVRHKRSRLTEFLSTNIGFNKTMTTDKKLHFITAAFIREMASESGLTVDIIDNKKVTSNNMFIIRKN